MGKAMKFKSEVVAIGNNGTVSAGFTIEPWAIFFGALFPAMDDGDIGLAMTIDGTNYNPIIDPVTGIDAIAVASGSDPGWVDFSDWIRFAYDNSACKIRFTCATQSSGAVDVTVIQRG